MLSPFMRRWMYRPEEKRLFGKSGLNCGISTDGSIRATEKDMRERDSLRS
jgi:hypothetical protein